MFETGDIVGDYEIVARLKSGGMATLFLGRRSGAAGFVKYVAIKVVHEHLAADPHFVDMFVDEAILCSRIDHPNVVHVEELRELDGRHFLVMEYVYGGSLGQILQELFARRRKLQALLAAHIAIKVADGLHAAHEATDEAGAPLGAVHRDVTPQNILISYRGNVKLIDFGVAKASGRRRETESGSIKGKFRYLATEQAFGQPVDRRTDIYQLGIVLWEMLTMRQRFDGPSDAGVLNRVRYPKAIPPSVHAPHITPALDEVVLKAMAPRPEDRFQTAREMREALSNAVPGSAALHESVLGQVIGVLVEEQFAEDAAKLPSSVARINALDSAASQVLLETHTVHLLDRDLQPLSDESTDPEGIQQAPTQLLDSLPEDEARAVGAAASFAEPDDESDTIPPPASAPSAIRIPVPLLFVGGVAVALLGLGLFVTIVALVFQTWSTDNAETGAPTSDIRSPTPPPVSNADIGAETGDAGGGTAVTTAPDAVVPSGGRAEETDGGPLASSAEPSQADPRSADAGAEPESGNRTRTKTRPRRRARRSRRRLGRRGRPVTSEHW